jgi:hypothetical protein
MLSQLKDHLMTGQDWEKLPTSIPGVSIVKVPGTKSRDGRLMVEVNPVTPSGQPKKRKGLFISDFEMYLQFHEALSDDRLANLVKTIDEVNPKDKSGEKKVLEL